MKTETILVALGGNALERNGDTSIPAQKSVAVETARQLVPLVKAGYRLAIVHGNGPQVGAIMLKEQDLENPNMSMPLNTAVAMSQGEIGYWLQQALQNELAAAGMRTGVATIVTQVVVDQNDPAFHDPTKPVGPFYPDQETAEAAAKANGFVVKEDVGRGWRRVVPSPLPKNVVEKELIFNSLDTGHVVIAAGGGGIPVIEQDGRLVGVDAVIDKDASASLLADLIGAHTLLILTGVDEVSINFKKPDETSLSDVTVEELQKYISDGQFAPGSMLPKVKAAISFASAKEGNRTIITSPAHAGAALEGTIGTRITL
ncbi:MAG TPA: carbamate kinase [Candidatus Saccharimonadales bacterium]|nr:carbamate kinase [Candidatus Saccharimonadales bacterium]